MTKQFLANTIAAALMSGGLVTHTQTPGAPVQTQQPTSGAAAAQATQGTETTLVGCLYRERDVPGRSPNIVERVGIGDDFIIADARPAGSRAEGLASGRMFTVEKVDDEQLTALVGHRVEVIGRAGVDADGPDLPEFQARSIRQVEGMCPAIPLTVPVPAPQR